MEPMEDHIAGFFRRALSLSGEAPLPESLVKMYGVMKQRGQKSSSVVSAADLNLLTLLAEVTSSLDKRVDDMGMGPKRFAAAIEALVNRVAEIGDRMNELEEQGVIIGKKRRRSKRNKE